jgi:hypothetical protein
MTATAIAGVFVLVYALKKWRLRPRDAVGFWRANLNGVDTGDEIKISLGGKGLRPLPPKTPPYPQKTDDTLTASTHSQTQKADVRFLRRVCIGDNCGTMDLSGRHIEWGKGLQWIREGVFNCQSCVT